MREEITKVYVAEDGRKFVDKSKCMEYEYEIDKRKERIKEEELDFIVNCSTKNILLTPTIIEKMKMEGGLIAINEDTKKVIDIEEVETETEGCLWWSIRVYKDYKEYANCGDYELYEENINSFTESNLGQYFNM